MALVAGYIALPKGGGSGLASVTPTFLLDDAAVTGTAPTSADSIAAGLKAAPVAEEKEEDEEEPVKVAGKVPVPVRTAAAIAVAPVATPVVAEAPAPAPEPEPVAAPVPEPAAPVSTALNGRIEDENGRPLVGATVLMKGSSKGTSTDANGNYSIEVPGGSEHSLIFGYGGYDDEVVRVNGSKPVNVTLTPRARSDRKRR